MCCTEAHLCNNICLSNNLKSLKIHWIGPQADTAFKLLKQVSTLKRLIVVVSKATTNHLSKREQALQEFFKQRKSSQTRLTDALGFDELLELHRLEEVKVQHINRTQALLRTSEERHSLESCLVDRIKI